MRNYGFDDDWWSGASVNTPSVKRLDDGIFGANGDEMISETQRLMAFLDSTDRSYGSVEALVRLDFVRDDDPDQVLGKYLQSWQEAVQRKTPQVTIDVFQSVGVKLLTSTQEELGRQPFSILDLRLDNGPAQLVQTLYDAMDDMIWEGPITNDETVAYLESVAEVFTVRVVNVDSQNSIRRLEIPVVWYPDRYLKESLGITREMRATKAEVYRTIDRMDRLQAALTMYQPVGGRSTIDPRRLLQSAIEHLAPTSEKDLVNGSIEGDRDEESEVRQRDDGRIEVAQQLKSIYDSVVEKLRGECGGSSIIWLSLTML